MTEPITGLIILAVVIILFFIRLIPAPVTAMLGCTAFALLGICSVSEAFSGFSNPVVILIVSMMIVGAAMRRTGLAAVIGDHVIRLSRNSERRFIFWGGLTAGALSAFLSNTAINVMFLTVIAAVSSANAGINRKNLIFPVVLCTMFGGVTTLVGSTTQLTAQGIIADKLNMELRVFDYTLPGIILFAVCMGYILLIGYPLGKRIWGGRDDREDAAEPSRIPEPEVRKSKRGIMLFIFAGIIVMFISGRVAIALTAVLAALLCMLCGCIDFKSAAREVNWSVVFLLAGYLGITKGITGCGADALLGNGVTALLNHHLSAGMIFAVFVCAAMLVSNFISNSAAVLLLLPIAISVCQTMGLNVKLFTLGIVFAASLAFSSPFANAQMGLMLPAGYRFSDYFRYTWLLDLLVLVIIITVFPMLIPVMKP